MKHFISILFLSTILVISLFSNASATFFIDFEEGVDGTPIDNIQGVIFDNFNGYAPRYGDTSTGNYNTFSDDLAIGGGGYHHNGRFWLWAGPEADARGVKIDFSNNDGTWFQTGYAANSSFFIDAYLTDGNVVSSAGGNNYGSPMSYLRVDAVPGSFIDYILIHDSGNYWVADDMSGDTTGVKPLPEPATMVLLGIGLLAMTALKKKTTKI